jgi:hypothetical protein
MTKRVVTAKILAMLADGPLTARELLAGVAGSDIRQITCTLNRLRTQKNQKVRICSYERSDLNGTALFYPRAVYCLGTGPDEPKPPPLTSSQYNRRRTLKNRVKRKRVASVFDLARVVNQRKAPKVRSDRGKKRRGAANDDCADAAA